MKKILLAGAAMIGATAHAVGMGLSASVDTQTNTVSEEKPRRYKKVKPKRDRPKLRPYQVGFYAALLPAEDPVPLTRQIIRRLKIERAKVLRHDDKMAALMGKKMGGAAVVRDLSIY